MALAYKSTRGKGNETVSASYAILQGLAEDGGLYVPTEFPKLDVPMESLKDMTYQEVAYEVMKLFLTDFTPEELRRCIAGAYDERFRVTIPACSGAGGIALFRTDNHGKVYDLSSLGGPDAWVNESINEPFENLQGGEGYWFCPAFRKAAGAAALPVDQHMLCALAAGKDRHMMIVTGITSEGWNNTEGQCLAYVASQRVWDMLGAGAHNNMIIHLDGHAILPSDLEKILDYCDVHLTGKKKDSVPGSRSGMKGELFLEENREKLCSLFDRFEKEIDTVLSYRNE